MFYIDQSKCIGCGSCTKNCPRSAISLSNDKAQIDQKLCNACGICEEVCPQGAVCEVSVPERTEQSSSPVQVNTSQNKIVSALAGLVPVAAELVSNYLQNRSSEKNNNKSCNYQGRGAGRRGCRKGRGRRMGRRQV
ncbi:MAG: 4Fe-4S binding protein [Clostridiales bacterium]|nr:4Fe-4S binding protein [Clostridiales bacterium]MCF8022734.1 4Fe-4S binding protein [Clostridiales bacterium]